MTSHFCPEEKRWKDGSVSSCPRHEQRRNTQKNRMGRNDRRKLDRNAGVIGEDSGMGFIRDAK